MNNLERILVEILLLLGVGGLLFGIGFIRGRNKARIDLKPKVDTLYHYDTIRLSYPVYFERKVVDTIRVAVRDTIREKDTLYIALPKEQKTYRSAEYMAVVSGIFPSLDYIETYSLTKTITQTIVEPRRRWGFSVGVGPSVIWSPWHGMDGGIGLFGGVTYTF